MARRACVCVCDCSSIAVVSSSRPHVENDVATSVEKWREKMKSFLIIFAAVADWHKQLVLSISTSSVGHTQNWLRRASQQVSETERLRMLSYNISFPNAHHIQPKNGKMELIKIFYRIDFIFISLHFLLVERERQGKTSIVSILVVIPLFLLSNLYVKNLHEDKVQEAKYIKEERKKSKIKLKWNVI